VTLLTTITAGGIVREPAAATEATPDPGDQHFWDLLAT
jgi:hypothetical protein